MSGLQLNFDRYLTALDGVHLTRDIGKITRVVGLVMEGFQKIANRISAGLILAALIVGASLLMQVNTRFQLFGYPGLAMLCFLAATAGGFWLLMDIFIQDHKDRKRATR